jgi:hypothetical protein
MPSRLWLYAERTLFFRKNKNFFICLIINSMRAAAAAAKKTTEYKSTFNQEIDVHVQN